MNTPKKSQQRFNQRLKSKGMDVDKKQLYWKHEAEAVKAALDKYKSSKTQEMTEAEAAAWAIIRRRGPAAIQRAKHAEAKYASVIARIDKERAEKRKKELAMKNAQPELATEATTTAPFEGGTPAKQLTTKDKSGAVHTPMSRARHLARIALAVKNKKKAPMKEDLETIDEVSSDLLRRAKHKAYSLSSQADEQGKTKEADKRFSQGIKFQNREYDVSKKEGKKFSKYMAQKEEMHPDALHVKPVQKDGKTLYKVHAVGKNFADGIKKGEHLSDTELDDFSEMGGKIKHLKEAVFAPVMKQGTSKQAYLGSRMKCQNCGKPAEKSEFKMVDGKEMCKDCQDDMKEDITPKETNMKSFKEIMEEVKRGRGRPRKNPQPETSSSDDDHEYGPSSRPASREGSSSHLIQQLHSAAHDDLPKKGRDVDFKHHTGFVPAHVARKAIEHYAGLKRSEDKANWAADHFEMHHKDFMKKYS